MKMQVLVLSMFLSIFFGLSSCTQSEGPEGAEQGESGIKWNKADIAAETLNGIRAIISFNAATNSFEGTFENLNSNVAQSTRLEVHVFDSSGKSQEFGPTTPSDMQPEEVRNVSLPIDAGTNFVKFSMHPEVGSGESGN